MEGHTNTLVIQTPEGISFSLLLAGPVTRFFALSIDLAVIFVAMAALSLAMGPLGLIDPDLIAAIQAILYFTVSIGYAITTEWLWRGQTIGKRLLGLRVMDVQGLRLHFSQVVIRNLLRSVDGLPVLYLVGGVACLLNRRSQRLGDIAANTIVVRTRRSKPLESKLEASGKYNSFKDYGHLVARLRQATSPAEAGLALEAVLRREQLDPEARVALFQEIAQHFRNKGAFPEEATLGLTDEKYVRNVVECLFETRRTPENA